MIGQERDDSGSAVTQAVCCLPAGCPVGPTFTRAMISAA